MKNKAMLVFISILALIIAININCSSSSKKSNDISFESLKTSYMGDIVSRDTIKVSPEVKSLEINITLPPKQKFNTEAPFNLIAAADSTDIIALGKQTIDKAGKNLSLPVALKEGQATLRIRLDFSYCGTDNSGICFFESKLLEIPVVVVSDGDNSFVVEYEVSD